MNAKLQEKFSWGSFTLKTPAEKSSSKMPTSGGNWQLELTHKCQMGWHTKMPLFLKFSPLTFLPKFASNIVS